MSRQQAEEIRTQIVPAALLAVFAKQAGADHDFHWLLFPFMDGSFCALYYFTAIAFLQQLFSFSGVILK